MGRVAVFIDADNMSSVLLKKIITYAKQQGDIQLLKIYGNKTSVLSWQKAVKLLNDNLLNIQFRQNSICKKNSSDIAITVDIMEVLMRNKADCFCLVSCDTDFTAVLQRIKQNRQKRVVVVVSNYGGKHLSQIAHDALSVSLTAPKDDKLPVRSHPKEDLQSMFLYLVSQAINHNANKYGLVDVSTVANYLRKKQFKWKQLGIGKLSNLLKSHSNFTVVTRDKISYVGFAVKDKRKTKLR